MASLARTLFIAVADLVSLAVEKGGVNRVKMVGRSLIRAVMTPKLRAVMTPKVRAVMAAMAAAMAAVMAVALRRDAHQAVGPPRLSY